MADHAENVAQALNRYSDADFVALLSNSDHFQLSSFIEVFCPTPNDDQADVGEESGMNTSITVNVNSQ